MYSIFAQIDSLSLSIRILSKIQCGFLHDAFLEHPRQKFLQQIIDASKARVWTLVFSSEPSTETEIGAPK